jgi:aminocarboxymuconate-semialdehyde decarboxylase
MPTTSIVDFHSHYLGPAFEPTTLTGLPPAQREYWESVNRRLIDPEAPLRSLAESGIAARVLSTPLEFVRGSQGAVAGDVPRRSNDALAEYVHAHPGQLFGLATVDAFSGEAGARELQRAVVELGLHGVFVESASGEQLPNASCARPTFAMAAELGVPVFMHPVPDAHLRRRFAPCGRCGERLVRGSINAAGLLAMLEAGMFEEMPGLHVVVTALALGGLCLAACWGDGARLRASQPTATRRHVSIDTTGLDAAMVRCAVELVGADHVLVGTDWPVVDEPALAQRVEAVLQSCGLDEEDLALVAGGNARRLMQARPAAQVRQPQPS